MPFEAMIPLIEEYKADKESVYNTWFVEGRERLAAFRAIKTGIKQVVEDIKNNTLGNDFKGSSLELVLNSITEQKQIFKELHTPFSGSPSSASLTYMRTRRIKSISASSSRIVYVPAGKKS